MWYVIEGFDGEGALAQRGVHRPAHVARLEKLRDEGRLLVAGPCPAIDADDPGPAGFSGSVVIAEFDSIEAARAWAAALLLVFIVMMLNLAARLIARAFAPKTGR